MSVDLFLRLCVCTVDLYSFPLLAPLSMRDPTSPLRLTHAPLYARPSFPCPRCHTSLPSLASVLIASGADLDARNKDNRTPLHLACIRVSAASAGCYNALLSALTDASPDGGSSTDGITTTATDKQTSNAVVMHGGEDGGGHVEVVRVLTTADANADATDSAKRTPLHYAAVKGHTALVTVLCKWGRASLELTDDAGDTALTLAVKAGALEATKALLTVGASVEHRTNRLEGELTPLHLACLGGHAAMVRLLLDFGSADISQNTRQGRVDQSFVLHVFHRYSCCGPCMPSALSL